MRRLWVSRIVHRGAISRLSRAHGAAVEFLGGTLAASRAVGPLWIACLVADAGNKNASRIRGHK